MSRLNQSFEWICPICGLFNVGTLQENEEKQPICINCGEQCDVYLDVSISVREVVPQGKNGSIPESLETDVTFAPDFGFNSPYETQEDCSKPAFMDHHFHRVGWFAIKYCTDGLPGYSIELRCVTCGRTFGNERSFLPTERIPSIEERLAFIRHSEAAPHCETM